MAMLYMDFRRSGAYKKMSFRKYLESIGFSNPAKDVVGMDDRSLFRATATGPELIDIPAQRVTGEVRVKVLLVDFPDRTGAMPAQHYEDLLFSEGVYPTGSMRDYYKEVSLGKVRITGSVHGWLRMPQSYSYYTNGESGTRWGSYPHNAPRLAEDAVNVALERGVQFEPGLDKFNQGLVTALFIVHAGRGAEVMPPSVRGNDIWSHKWNLRNPVQLGPNLAATVYLVVPNDCKVGVCAHELGHLAFQWQDFYDPNYDEDGKEWDGSGSWDLMAGGSYNGDGARPAHPAGLHKLQHGWINSTTVRKSRSITLKPYSTKYGRVYKLISSSLKPKQYLLLENRRRVGFDFQLPGEGLLVWRVDESGEQEAPDQPGLYLVQADGRHNLEDPNDWNQGDAGDPFPGSGKKTELGETGSISTSFPGMRSGIALQKIQLDQTTGIIKLQAKFTRTSPSPAKAKGKRKARRKSGSLGRR
jgi:immune inhibitor A